MEPISTTEGSVRRNSAPADSPATPASSAGGVSVFTCGAQSEKFLVENPDAKASAQEKLAKAIKLIEEYSPKYHEQGYGPDFSKELKELGATNIKLEPATEQNGRSMADSKYVEKPPTRAFTRSMGYSSQVSRIALHFNNKSVYEASPEEIATTIVHELGHLKDKDNEDSIQEERDVEIQARNFGEFVKNSSGFKFNNNPDKMEDFLNIYRKNPCRTYPATSPKHGI